MPTAVIIATYRVHCAASEVEALAKAIAWEQTVEVVEAVVSTVIQERLVGKIAEVRIDNGSYLIEIHYNPELASNQLGQLLNLAYGNVSLYRNVRLENLDIPNKLASAIDGPQYGIHGIRDLIGVEQRPLLATAIKPRGETHQNLAAIAGAFALGGGDIIKDDQNLVDEQLDVFKQRVTACAQAVEQACQQTGRYCLYLPHITGSGRDLERRLAFVKAIGLRGVLMCPMVMGLQTAKQAALDYDLIYMAHPALAGSYYRPTQHGMAANILQGLLYRLGGADISIFTSEGGRISTSEETCKSIHHDLIRPLGAVKPSLACPAGGNTLNLIPKTIATYGQDVLILCGGALLAHNPDITTATEIFADTVQTGFKPILHQVPLPCTRLPVTDSSYLLKKTPTGWTDRATAAYKTDQTLPHSNASRTELIGQASEDTTFNLRYFELQPGGNTSLEQHQHTHVVIGVIGQGSLQIGDNVNTLMPHDMAYIPGNTPHQLQNTTDEPFGFYCLVDRRRDKPIPVNG